MGNCQAIDAAALVIQHPTGKIERFYWPILAGEVMKMNPDHYVSLIIPLPVSDQDHNPPQDKKTVQFTSVKLLRPTDTLALGHAYRLVTTQEVVKVLREKKAAKMKRQQPESVVEKTDQMAPERLATSDFEAPRKPHMDKDKDKYHQATKHERQRPRAPADKPAVMRSKSWRPSLRSISEATS